MLLGENLALKSTVCIVRIGVRQRVILLGENLALKSTVCIVRIGAWQ